ncbi:brain and acute leukemia cytoplasmic protein [Gadus chalcogrammus]|uniref:brain and acute leukemia cytoplasmic protein n=1 Tax=Gadus chalcogrammus TaxID=1042646 RepID=UPI0024C48E51|nr:brain and acute leukemia cytoplasmic protein [Gadus chalcogrammus]XP_056437021.1 brain and acute leukemia cytoplasmic protein [Gadus chalcogrammus]
MGCGGSRMDVLEPHYLESWTKDTESTWLASTDTDIPLSSIQSLASESSFDTGFTSEKTSTPVPDIFEDGLPHPAQAYVKVCSSLSEASLDEETEATTPPTKHPSPDQGPIGPPAGTTVQRRSVLHTEEITKWQNNKMSTKQVTITVTQSVRQVDQRGKVQEKSLTTYEVLKPLDPTLGRGERTPARPNAPRQHATSEEKPWEPKSTVR